MKYLFFICLIYHMPELFCQEDITDKKPIEIGLTLVSGRYFPELRDNHKHHKLTAPNGFIINITNKYYHHNFGTNIFYFNESVNEDGNCFDCFGGTGKYKAIELYYGFYRDFRFNSFKLSLGSDAYSIYSNYFADLGGGYYGQGMHVDDNCLHAGIRPSLIFNYRLANSFFIFLKFSGGIDYKIITTSLRTRDFYYDYFNSFGILYKIK